MDRARECCLLNQAASMPYGTTLYDFYVFFTFHYILHLPFPLCSFLAYEDMHQGEMGFVWLRQCDLDDDTIAETCHDSQYETRWCSVQERFGSEKSTINRASAEMTL